MNTRDIVPLSSDRLLLVSLDHTYAEDIFQEFTDEVTPYMMPKSAKRIEETQVFIASSQQKMERGEELVVVILDKQTKEFLGVSGAHALQTKTPVLGIWTKKSAHGNKYGREAVMRLKQWIDENISYDYIVYPADKRNIASRKIAESLGGVISDEYKKTNQSGNVLDEVEYRIYKRWSI